MIMTQLRNLIGSLIKKGLKMDKKKEQQAIEAMTAPLESIDITVESLTDFLKRVSYRDDFNIKVSNYSDDVLEIAVQLNTKSVDSNKDCIIQFTRYYPLNYLIYKTRLLSDIKSLLVDIQLHEIDETFRYDGECIYEPHINPLKIAG